MTHTKINLSKYKGVSKIREKDHTEKWMYSGTIDGLRFAGKKETEREAAVAYDIVMVKRGRKPINVLTKKD